jgi:hypothetical protein
LYHCIIKPDNEIVVRVDILPIIGLGYLGADIISEMTTDKGMREQIDKQFGDVGFSVDF